MPTDVAYDHAANVYLTVTTYRSSQSSLATAHPAVSYIGPVGGLSDVHVVSVPKDAWSGNERDIMRRLKGVQGVMGVEVQPEPRRRVKRDDEL